MSRISFLNIIAIIMGLVIFVILQLVFGIWNGRANLNTSLLPGPWFSGGESGFGEVRFGGATG